MTVQAGGPGPLSSLPTFSANYSYDNVNRVSSTSDSGGWSRSFHYDQYGNLWTTSASGTPISGLMPTANVYNGNNQIMGNAYDGAGNLTALGTYTLVYDAENRLTQATDAPSAGGGSVQYFYDAGGQRVMRQFAGGARSVYVYDAFGQLAAEYSSAAADTVTPACGTCYLTTDHLGSTRLVTDADGNVVARHDYLPFGEEVPAGSAGRTGQWGAFDSVSQKFTGQERDSETGLDFFQARHFSNVLGRFLSADPGNAGADLSDPQTWNGYSYVRNNPLALVDPSGMDGAPADNSGGFWSSVWNGIRTGIQDIFNSLGGPSQYPNCVAYGTEGCIQAPTVTLTFGGGFGGGMSTGSASGGGGSSASAGAPTTSPSTNVSSAPAKSEVPDNVCQFAGNALDPSFWASAGKASKWDPVSAVLDLTKGFKIGEYLDAQPMASGDPYQRAAYGNYLFGAWMRASGTPLPVALAGANEIAFIHKISNPNQYRGRQMDSFFWSLPAANVANIVNGYNAQKNGTLCHK